MNRDTIVQFVCFISPLEHEEFMEMWEPFAKLLVKDSKSILLHERISEKKNNSFTYVSQHTCHTADFSFVFMKGKSKDHFPEHKARIKQAGGYLPLQVQCRYNKSKTDATIIAFVAHGETELDFYRHQSFHYLNIYEAYFENCAYGYVMEFFLEHQEAPALLTLLQARTGVEAALYKECCFSMSSKKVSGSLL